MVEAVFQAERGRILATLIRLARNFDSAEEALQDAVVEALEHWPSGGVPAVPGVWTLTTAKRKLLDRARVQARRSELLLDYAEPITIGRNSLSSARREEAAVAYRRGLSLAVSPIDQEFLREQLTQLGR